LAKSTVPAGGSNVVAGQTISVTVTWTTTDWVGTTLDRIADCVEVGGVESSTLSTEEKPTANDGSFTHQYVIPSVAAGTQVCDRARLSGNPAPQNESTQKSNIVCFNVVDAPTFKATARANKTVSGTEAPSLTPGWTLELKQGTTLVSSLTSDALAGFQDFLCASAPCELTPGLAYTITEVGANSGYTTTASGDGASGASCSFTVPDPLTADTTFSCTFNNHKDGEIIIPPPPPPPPAVGTLIVEKQTDPDGATQAFSFSGAALGTSGASLSDGQSTSRTVGPGTYTVSELQPDGWDLTSITCTDSSTGGSASTGDVASSTATFRVEANETARCVFTNTEEADEGTIIVTKQTLPDGAEDEFGFAGDLSGDISDGESLSATVEPGTYTVAEHAADGWELTDISCTDSDGTGLGSSSNLSERSATLNVDPGETVECEFTNTEIEVLPRPPIVRTPEEPKVLPKDAVLPFTGGDPASFLTTAGLLIAAGGALTLGGRRRRRP
jgi:LPXTG-motif cell wall-anchored protein